MSRKRVFHIVLGGLVVLAVLFVAGIFVVRSARFHRMILATAIERAEKALGTSVEIGDFSFHWSGMRVALYRVSVYGTEPQPRTPLLQADEIDLGLKIISFWKRKIDLQEIVAEHPVVHVSVDQQGRMNLPRVQSQPGEPTTNIFDLAIGHVVIRRGEIQYQDHKTPLDAELRGLQAQVSFAAAQKAYDGTLGYHDGVLQYGAFKPLQHDLEANFTAAPDGLKLKSLRLSSGTSWVTAQANLQDYSNPTVDGNYTAEFSTAELADIIKDPSLPLGRLATKGVLQYRNKPDQPPLDSLSIQGELSSSGMALKSDQARLELTALSGQYILNHGDLQAPKLQANVLGGHFSGELSVRNVTGSQDGRLTASFQNFSIPAANAALTARPLGDQRISGRADGTVSANWHGSISAIQFHSDATVTAAQPVVVQQAVTSSNSVPLNGTIHISYDGRSDTITLQNTSLRTPHTSINVDGTLARNSNMRIQARSDDLREVDMLALGFRKATGTKGRPAPPPQLLGLGGAASFDGQLQGTTKAPRLAGQLQGQNLSYEGTTLRTVRARLDASPSGIQLHEGQLQMNSQGNARGPAQSSIQFDATVGLVDWSYTKSNPIQLRATANGVPVADLQHLARLQYPVTGTLTAQISIQGSVARPSGTASIRLSSATAWDQPIQDLSIQLRAAEDTVHSALTLRTPAGSGNATVNYYPSEEGFDAQAEMRGIQIEKLEPVRKRNLQASGVVNISARGSGTIDAPVLDASIDAPKLRIREQSLDGLKATANVRRKEADFSLDSVVSGASIQARGTVQLTGAYDATATFNTQTIQLGPLVGSYLHGQHVQDFRGQIQLHASLQGPLKDPSRVQGTLEIPSFNMGYQSVQLASAGPIRMNYRSGILTMEPANLKGTGTDIRLQATVPVTGDGQLRAAATGTVDLSVAQMMFPGGQTSGQLKLDLTAAGSRDHPEFQGGVHLVDGVFQLPDAPLGLEKVNADFGVEKTRVLIRNLTAQSGGGTLTGQGSVSYSPVRFDLAVAAKGVRLRYPEGVRAVLQSDLLFTGTPDSAMLSGQVLLNRVSTTDSFDIANFVSQFSGPSSSSPPGMADNVRLNVTLRSTQDMEVASSELSLAGSADLRLQGTAADPVIIGRTEIRGGEMFFNGRRYQVQQGVIQFANPVRTEPVVNLVVTTTVNQYELTMSFVGPIDRMRTSYSSDPPLPPVDVLNLLVTGRSTEAASANPSTPQSMLAGQMAGQVSNRLGKLAGISSLTIDPQIGGNGTNPGARMAIQQRVTKNLFFTFATDVTSTQDPLVQVEYQLTKKYSVSALRDQNGGYSLQVKMRKKF